MYALLLVLIYVAFISLGLPDSLLGSAWPVMHAELELPVSYMGVITMVISGCTVISGLLSDKLTKKFGANIVTVVSVFMTSAALFGFSFGKNLLWLIIFAIPYGLGAGAIDAALNNYVALHYSSRCMMWLHCFWGVGTIASPFIMSCSLTRFNWRFGYRVVGFIQLFIAILLLITLPVWKVNKKADEETKTKSLKLLDVFKIKGAPTLFIGFFCYCAMEATSMGWVSTYMVEVKKIEPEKAAGLASLCYIGITLGRFLIGFISEKLTDRQMINAGALVLAFGVVLLFIPSSNPYVSFAGFIVIGLGCAPIYPCMVHLTPDTFGREVSGSIIGVQMASAYLGMTFMPPLFGLLGGVLGFKILPFFLMFFIVVMITMTETTFKISKNKKLSAV